MRFPLQCKFITLSILILTGAAQAQTPHTGIYTHFSVEPLSVKQGQPITISIHTSFSDIKNWTIHHPYTILKEETLPGFQFHEENQQAYYGPNGMIEDNGQNDLDPEAGKLRIQISTKDWPSGIHNFTIEPSAIHKGPDHPALDYRDFAIKVQDPKDHLAISIEPDRYFAEGTHFNTMFVTSSGRVISDGKYSDDKGYTWKPYTNDSLLWGKGHSQSAMISHEFTDSSLLGLAYRTLPKEGEKGAFIGQRYTSDDNGQTIKDPFECPFTVPHAVGSHGHAYHPGPLFMRSIVEIDDGSLLALMCGWFDTDTKESPVHGQNYRRSFLTRSTDNGQTWKYYSTIAYEPNWGSEGWNEGSLKKLENGTLIAAIRSGSDSQKWKDNPLCIFYSKDQGLTWDGPHRTGIDGVYPCLVVMSNGVLACSYGRPGAKIMFSADQGKTWTDHTSVHPERYSGYTWIAEVAPGELLYGFGLRNGLDPETGERKNMLRLTNIQVVQKNQ